MHRHELKEAYDYENKSQLNGDGAKIIGNIKTFQYLQAALRTSLRTYVHAYIHTTRCGDSQSGRWRREFWWQPQKHHKHIHIYAQHRRIQHSITAKRIKAFVYMYICLAANASASCPSCQPVCPFIELAAAEVLG